MATDQDKKTDSQTLDEIPDPETSSRESCNGALPKASLGVTHPKGSDQANPSTGRRAKHQSSLGSLKVGQELLRCVRCAEIPDYPRRLDCYHTMCFPCLERFYPGSDDIICLKCYNVTSPQETAEFLPENILLKPWRRARSFSGPKLCGMCRVKGQCSVSSHVCFDCGAGGGFLCSDCIPIHNVVTQSHKALAIENLQEDLLINKIRDQEQEICGTHSCPNETLVMKFLCTECNTLACRDCLMLDHKKHSYLLLSRATAGQREFGRQTISKAKHHMKQSQKSRKAVKTHCEEARVEANRVIERLRARASELKQTIDNESKMKIKALEFEFENMDGALEKQVCDQEKNILGLETRIQFVQVFSYIAGVADYFANSQTMHDELDEYSRESQDPIEGVFPTKLLAGDTVDISHLVDDLLPKVLLNFEVEIIHEFKCPNSYGITGLAVTPEDKVIVVRGATQYVDLYGTDGSLLGTIERDDVCSSWDVAVDGGLLYVTDIGRSHITVLGNDGASNRTIQIEGCQGLDSARVGIAVNSQGDLYVCHNVTSLIYKCGVDDTTARALIPSLDAPTLRNPCYLTCAPNADILVSNWNGHTVHVYDGNGKFKTKFGCNGSKSDQLNSPLGICTDQHGFVYICDWFNSRIQVFSIDYEHVGCFPVNCNAFKAPLAVAVNSKGHVVVSHSTDRITTYKVHAKLV